jgi:hypothetical protein
VACSRVPAFDGGFAQVGDFSSDVTIKKGIQRAYNKAQAQMEELFAKEGDADKDLVLTEKKKEELDAGIPAIMQKIKEVA